jgi:hypothetical protein
MRHGRKNEQKEREGTTMESELERAKEERKIAETRLKKAEAELQNKLQTTYIQEHIEPCRKALANTSELLLKWADTLSDAKIDVLPLCQHLGNTVKLIERHIAQQPM